MKNTLRAHRRAKRADDVWAEVIDDLTPTRSPRLDSPWMIAFHFVFKDDIALEEEMTA